MSPSPVDETAAVAPPSTDTDAFPIPAAQRQPKLSGWDFYRQTLGSPRLVVAPMVDQSELAWRLLSRRHGAQLCYSPMFHANIFATDPKYRAHALQSCAADRPLIIQFCGNDPQQLLAAALLAQDHCDAVDINLGCPQAIAKRGHYGAYLQDEWPLLESIVRLLHDQLAVPVTCKIRVFEDRERTVRYAQMLERAGAQLLTVHGRTREQKGPLTGLADWSYIRLVRDAVRVPMFANGNIQSVEDVRRCIEETGVQGVMTAEGNLHNPALFDANGRPPVVWELAIEYLDLVDRWPCPTGYVRGHLFKLLHHLLALPDCQREREMIATGTSMVPFRQAVVALRERYEPVHEGRVAWPEAMTTGSEAAEAAALVSYDLHLPPWLCQPYVRTEPEEHRRHLAAKEAEAADPQRERTVYRDELGAEISRKQAKRLRRAVRKPGYQPGARTGVRRDRAVELCRTTEWGAMPDGRCGNPAGLSCEHGMCRQCCKKMCWKRELRCEQHTVVLDTKRRRRTSAGGVDVAAKTDENAGTTTTTSTTTTTDVDSLSAAAEQQQ